MIAHISTIHWNCAKSVLKSITILTVTGSRNFNNYELLKKTIRSKYPDVQTIVTGCGEGTDSLAARYAREDNRTLIQISPNYAESKQYPIELSHWDMLNKGQEVLAFWDGSSSNTGHVISRAKTLCKPLRTIKFTHV